jgi:hypothetical protein
MSVESALPDALDDVLDSEDIPVEADGPDGDEPSLDEDRPREETEIVDLVPDPERDEIERLLSDTSHTLKLSSGSTVRIRPLKLREFLRLLRIITRGGSSLLGNLELDFDNPEEFIQSLLAMILFSVPEAEQETVDFITTMCEPEHLSGNAKDDAQAYLLLAKELDNPELEDMTNILAVVVRTEGRDLQALGKRLRTMFDVARKMGLVGSGARNAA